MISMRLAFDAIVVRVLSLRSRQVRSQESSRIEYSLNYQIKLAALLQQQNALWLCHSCFGIGVLDETLIAPRTLQIPLEESDETAAAGGTWDNELLGQGNC